MVDGAVHPRIGLVLGGGGAVGHGFHHGVLAALEDVTGFDPRSASVVVGTSSGATTAVRVRVGATGQDLASRACSESGPARRSEALDRPVAGCPPRGYDRATRDRPPLPAGPPASPRVLWAAVRRPRTARLGIVAASLLPTGTVPTVAAGGPIDRLAPGGWPSEPLWIAAVRISDGHRVLFGRPGEPAAELPSAVAASCALPGWFAPVTIGGDRYIDGAAWSATNADVLIDEGLDLVVVSAPLSGRTSLFHRLQRGYLREEVRALRRAGAEVVALEPTLRDLTAMGPDVMDRSRREAVTRLVRERTRRRLVAGDLRRARTVIGGAITT